MHPIWDFFAIIAFLLQSAIVWLMQRKGFVAILPFLFLYVIGGWLGSVAEYTALFWHSREAYASYYWTIELILQVFLFLAMMHFIYLALEDDPRRWRKAVYIGIAVVGGAILTLLLYSEPNRPIPDDRKNAWVMSQLSRNLSFCSALLNLVLWNALMKRKRRDLQLLLLSAGIGLLTTGKAIGHSLRLVSRDLSTPGNVFIVFSTILALGIWFWTFRNARVPQLAAPPSAPPHIAD